MFKALLTITFELFLGLHLGAAPVAKPGSKSKPQVMLLGVYHFQNPNLDAVKTDFDSHLTPKKQREIESLVQKLKAFNPTKICIEIPKEAHQGVNEDYRDYLQDKHALREGEHEQIGFRLARLLKHKEVYPIDCPMEMKQAEEAVAHAEKHQSELFAFFQKKLEQDDRFNEKAKGMTVVQHFYRINDPRQMAEELRFYARTAQMGDAQKAQGAVAVASWYERNWRIYAHLMGCLKSPRERVLVIFGSGHMPFLKRMLEDSGDVVLVDPLTYLK